VGWDTFMGGTLIFLAAVSLHGFVRRMPISAATRAFFMILALGIIYPEALVQAACAAVGLGCFALLQRSARSSETKPQLAAA
jgi:lipopolysaccharide export LptBFGC system permease protein LptF